MTVCLCDVTQASDCLHSPSAGTPNAGQSFVGVCSSGSSLTDASLYHPLLKLYSGNRMGNLDNLDNLNSLDSLGNQ